MRYVVILVLLTIVPCWSQTTQTGKAETSGPCSPAVSGSKNTFTINCGIGKAQGDMLLKIVNRILSNQTNLKRFGDILDVMLRDIDDIRQSVAEQGVPHIQPELVIDSVESGLAKFHVSVWNISGNSTTDVHMSQNGDFGHLPFVTTILPSRGRVSVPGFTELSRSGQLHLAFTYKSKVNGVNSEFLSSNDFTLPEVLVQGVIDPRYFFEATGATFENARAAMLHSIGLTMGDAFARLPKGTIEFWTTERRDDGEPNFIRLDSDTRSFSYDPVRRIAWLRAEPASDPIVKTFEPKTRHMIAFEWDETGPTLVSVDGESVTTTTPRSQ